MAVSRAEYRRGVNDRAEVARSGAEPRSLTERRDIVVEQAFISDGVDGLKAAYDAYGAVIHRFCSRTLGPDAAGDATQEVFVAAWRDRDRFDPARGPLIGWLMGIARNKVKGVARDTGRHPVPVAAVEQTATPDAVDALADRLVVARSLRALPERAASVVRLAYLDGHSHQEVADHLGLPLGTVKSDIRRGLERLRRDLGAIDG